MEKKYVNGSADMMNILLIAISAKKISVAYTGKKALIRHSESKVHKRKINLDSEEIGSGVDITLQPKKWVSLLTWTTA